jgi:NADH:ubiquinone oxidoreductase subunit 6 (subunit J)
MAQPTKNERDLGRVVKLSSALAMGVMAGLIYAVKSVHPTIRVEFSVGVVLITLLVGAATWMFLAVIIREEGHRAEGVKGRRRFLNRWMLVFVVITVIATVAAFARSLRGVSSEKVRDVIEGTVGAILFVSLFLYLLWRLLCFLEKDSERNAQVMEQSDKDDPA